MFQMMSIFYLKLKWGATLNLNLIEDFSLIYLLFYFYYKIYIFLIFNYYKLYYIYIYQPKLCHKVRVTCRSPVCDALPSFENIGEKNQIYINIIFYSPHRKLGLANYDPTR